MDEEQEFENENNYISPRYLLSLLKPIIKDELIAQCREDRFGLSIKFRNGQQFLLTIGEIE
ncbi:MAG: hypothetical protein K2N47_03445 [Clostridia bacterium]|nr:hypothetical protein [Clostridia bacterium]